MNLKAGEYKLVIDPDGSQSTYDANGNRSYFKTSDGFESWHEYDANGNQIHHKNSDGVDLWYEYDAKGNLIYYKNSKGYEYWWDANGNYITKAEFNNIHNPSCAGKVVEIDGKQYKLVDA